jgi:hypothetical protein
MRNIVHAGVVAICAVLITSTAQAGCALSPAPHPAGALGLHLFYPDDARSWEWADDLRVPWVRIEFRWDWMEPHQGQFDASYIDRVIALAERHPQKVMALFNQVPGWAERNRDQLPTRAAAALTWLLQKHGSRISAIEVFNEPNLPGYGWPKFGSPRESAALYARTLTAASSAIRAQHKTAHIISAGLSPQNDPESYARNLVRLTPPSCYDALGLHPYGQQGRFDKVRRNVAMLMDQEKSSQKPIWFTEYGTDQDTQRAGLIESLRYERTAVPITFIFAERDLGRWFTDSYGLRRKDGSPKADYEAFKRLNLTPITSLMKAIP